MEILMGKCSRRNNVAEMRGGYDQESILHRSLIVVDILQPKTLSTFVLEKKKKLRPYIEIKVIHLTTLEDRDCVFLQSKGVGMCRAHYKRFGIPMLRDPFKAITKAIT